MKFSSLVHDGRPKVARYPPRSLSTGFSLNIPSEAYQPVKRDMASGLTVHTRSKKHSTVNTAHPQTPRTPPSPPADYLHNCTLPSIQSLIGMANGTPAQSFRKDEVDAPVTQHQQLTGNDQVMEAPIYSNGQHTVSNPYALPPTPPLQPKCGFDSDHQSQSAASARSTAFTSNYSASAINNVEPHQQRQPQPQHHLAESISAQRQPSHSPYMNSPYTSSPGVLSTYSYPSPAQPVTTTSGLYYQKSLPAAYPAPELSATVVSPMPASHSMSPIDHTNPWQHHHYISPSASAALAGQAQDRYICQTCNKAFSRPSSLRIHSHSHTGEKPFKCHHNGCGKAFSVRSNMKRHERGCHGGGSPGCS